MKFIDKQEDFLRFKVCARAFILAQKCSICFFFLGVFKITFLKNSKKKIKCLREKNNWPRVEVVFPSLVLSQNF